MKIVDVWDRRGILVFLKNRKLEAALLAVFLLAMGSVSFADISRQGSSVGKSSSVTTTLIAIGEPQDLAVGDFLLASIAFQGGDQGTITAPSGWNLALRTDYDQNLSVATYWKFATTTSAATSTWSIDIQTRAVGGITRYTGVDTISPIEASSGDSGHGTTLTAPAITTTLASTTVVAVFAHSKGTTSGSQFTTPSGMSEIYDYSNITLGPSIAADDVFQLAATSTGAKTSTIGSQRDWIAQQIALRSAVPLRTNLAHYWKLDESSGSAIDVVGGLTLTNNHSTPFESGLINNAPHFNGSNQNLTTSTNLVNSVPSAYTFCSWINVDNSDPGNGYNFFISYDTNLAIRFTYINNSGTKQIRFVHNDGNGDAPLLKYDVTLTADEWHQVCGTWNDPSLTLYLDGSAVATSSASGAYSSVDSDLTSIGSSLVSGTDYFDGQIDEVGFWTRALTATEISQLYNGGVGTQYPF